MTRPERFWTLERALLILSIVVSGYMWYAAQSYVLTARRFPQLVSAIVFALSVYLLVVQVIAWQRGPATDNEESKEADKGPVLHWGIGLLLSLGFLVCTYLFGIGTGLLAFVTLCSKMLGLRWPGAIIYGAVFSVMLWFFFGVLLTIPLPEGALVHLF